MNLTNSELCALKSLCRNKTIAICKPDKGNGVVLLDKSNYDRKIMDIVGDSTKFVELSEDPTIKREKSLQEYLYYLKTKGVLDESAYQKVRPQGSKPARIYGLPKLHKPDTSLRPIVSSIGTYGYEISKLLSEILKPLSSNEFTVKDSFSFVNEILTLSDVQFMASFDIVSLFTNIPLQEAIDITLDKLFKDSTKVHNFSRRQLNKLLKLVLKANHFLFNGKIYNQIDGVAMGSSLGPILANIFMSHFEKNALSQFTGTLPCTY